MSSSDEEVSNLMKPADQEDVGSDPGLMPERSESERGLGSGKTAAEEQVEVCRYCLEEAPKNELFRPCQCTNPVHTSCLRRWLTTGPSQVRLKCELCNGAIEAKQELAAYSVLIKDKEGRSILLATLLRLAYRLFLCRRLLTRYRPVMKRWRGVCSRNNPLDDGIMGFFERATLYRDSGMGLLLGALCCHMFARDIRSFLASFALLRSKKATLTFVRDDPSKPRTRSVGGLDQSSANEVSSEQSSHVLQLPRNTRAPVDLQGSFRALLAPVWSFANRHGSHGGIAAMRLSLGLEISHVQAEMALGMR
eukprot:CAMPEP_0173096786 /NCGR_PEP_ID=MMETSP1102-20130122/33267_1 /TAXON_ID=49646 /ORGANISM="Geminigera sp., Strain Caron Lab Isolate" /LENGTH=306 /DNA_ID=CAMNT_0013988007 /DNA_START=51 /DNA_END=971 /DNA_ORIENTATION=+